MSTTNCHEHLDVAGCNGLLGEDALANKDAGFGGVRCVGATTGIYLEEAGGRRRRAHGPAGEIVRYIEAAGTEAGLWAALERDGRTWASPDRPEGVANPARPEDLSEGQRDAVGQFGAGRDLSGIALPVFQQLLRLGLIGQRPDGVWELTDSGRTLRQDAADAASAVETWEEEGAGGERRMAPGPPAAAPAPEADSRLRRP